VEVRKGKVEIMTKVKITVFLFVLLVNASTADVQETRPGEKLAVPPKEVPRTKQKEKPTTKVPKVSASSWQKLSDRQIARMLFREERLYFQEDISGLFKDPGASDEIAVHEVKRMIANFDNDKDSEMAVLLRYSRGECNYCVGNVIIAILDDQRGQLRVAWSTKKHALFDDDGTTDIWATRLIKKDNFPQLVLKYGRLACSGCSHKRMTIVRWNGKEFTEIWGHDIEKYNHGGHDEYPYRYVANVEFTRNDRPAKEIRVTSIYLRSPHSLKQVEVTEEFAWSEKEQRYLAMRRREYMYENGELYGSSMDLERQQKTTENCYKIDVPSKQ
jgi:hypothetical protein